MMTPAEELDFVYSGDPRLKGFNPPAPVPCEYCGAPRYTRGFFLGSSVKWNFCGPETCGCPEAQEARAREKAEREAEEARKREEEAALKMRMRVQEIIGGSGINARFLRRTFERFQVTEQNERALRICREYADTFRDKLPEHNEEPGRNGLFITGPMGTGKTHLVAAIANQLMRGGTPVLCMTMIDLLDQIKRTYAQYGDGISESALLGTYKTVPLLIIDDMGKEPATDWAVSKIYAIVNARYEAYMPTIVTTNYTDGELVRRLTPKDTGDPYTAECTVDRLREMCAAIVTRGDSWRGK